MTNTINLARITQNIFLNFLNANRKQARIEGGRNDLQVLLMDLSNSSFNQEYAVNFRVRENVEVSNPSMKGLATYL